jgi:anti-anti-sigma regulatory factor
MLKIDITQDGTKGVITLQGAIKIQSAGRFKEAMVGALSRFDEIRLDFTMVSFVDISCFQILCSAHRTAMKGNKVLVCSGALPEEFKRRATESGYIRNNGCAFDDAVTCIWAMK